MQTKFRNQPENIIRMSQASAEQARRYAKVLELMKGAAAASLRVKIHAQLGDAYEATQRVTTVRDQMKAKKQVAVHTDRGFVGGLTGMMNLLEVAAPELYPQLPPIATLSKTDPDGYAETLCTALPKADKEVGKVLAGLIRAGMEARLANTEAYVKTREDQLHLQKGRVAISDLKQLIAQADSLIHSDVPAGSPLYDLLKAPRKPRAKKDKPAQGAKPAGSETPAHVEGPTPASKPATLVPVEKA